MPAAAFFGASNVRSLPRRVLAASRLALRWQCPRAPRIGLRAGHRIESASPSLRPCAPDRRFRPSPPPQAHPLGARHARARYTRRQSSLVVTFTCQRPAAKATCIGSKMLIVVLAVSTEGGEVTLEPPIQLVLTGQHQRQNRIERFLPFPPAAAGVLRRCPGAG